MTYKVSEISEKRHRVVHLKVLKKFVEREERIALFMRSVGRAELEPVLAKGLSQMRSYSNSKM